MIKWDLFQGCKIVIYIYVHFQILFHSKLLQDIEYSPMCKTSVSLEETYEIFWYSNTQDWKIVIWLLLIL